MKCPDGKCQERRAALGRHLLVVLVAAAVSLGVQLAGVSAECRSELLLVLSGL